MVEFAIDVTPEANRDLNEIDAYVRQHSVPAADRLARRFAAAIDSLAHLPTRHQVRAQDRSGQDVRALVVHPYLIFYRVDEKPPTVIVVTIRHGRREPRQF